MQYKFWGDREICVSKIKESINTYSRKELYAKFSSTEWNSIVIRTRGIATGMGIDSEGNVRFSDEVDPDIVTDYIMEQKNYTISRELVYHCVCRTMAPIINVFYGDLKKYDFAQRGHILGAVHIDSSGSLEDNRARYNELYEKCKEAFRKRKELPHKRLFGKN